MMEDLAILTGGKVLARDLGDSLEDITREIWAAPSGSRRRNSDTMIIRGDGDPQAIAARRAQVQRLYENAPPNIDKDKLQERLAKLCGGTAMILAGGVTPVEQKRTIQLIEDALNAVRAAAEEGVLVGRRCGAGPGGASRWPMPWPNRQRRSCARVSNWCNPS